VNIAGIQRRTQRVEQANNNRGPRDIDIRVEYYDTINTADGRRELPVPGEYDPVDFDTIAPDCGDRIAVRYPKDPKQGGFNA